MNNIQNTSNKILDVLVYLYVWKTNLLLKPRLKGDFTNTELTDTKHIHNNNFVIRQIMP